MLRGFFSKSIWLRVRWIALLCCLFFTLIAFVQFYLSNQQLDARTNQELKRWMADLVHQIGPQPSWDLKRYDQIDPKAPSFVVLTNANFAQLFWSPPGLIKQVQLARDVASDQPETVTTSAGSWRVYKKTLFDGYVILSIDDPEDVKSADKELRDNVARFGSSLQEAQRVEVHETTPGIGFAVIDRLFNLKNGTGVLPVITNPSYLEYPRTTIAPFEAHDGKRYKVLYEPIFDTSGKQNGVVIVSRDTELEAQMIRNQRLLIIIATGITWSFFLFQVLYSWKKTEEEKSAFRRRIEGYFSPPVLEDILREGRTLGGERREVSIPFADIRSFTSLSEKLPPMRLIELLRDYFTEMTTEILAADGVVDKFVGDAIMAFWGAPIDQLDKADRAVTTAMKMIKRLPALNDKRAKEGCPPLQIGIGVNTGVAIVGNVGSRTRFDYTLIGDEVNVASRLEGLTKQFGCSIIISESTKRSLTVSVALEPLGEAEIRGREEPVKIYKVKI